LFAQHPTFYNNVFVTVTSLKIHNTYSNHYCWTFEVGKVLLSSLSRVSELTNVSMVS